MIFFQSVSTDSNQCEIKWKKSVWHILYDFFGLLFKIKTESKNWMQCFFELVKIKGKRLKKRKFWIW